MSSHSSVGDLKTCSSHQSGSNPEVNPSESESEASSQQSSKDSGFHSFSSESGSGNYKTDTPKLFTAISVIKEEMNILDVYQTNSLVLENFFRFLLKVKKSESLRHPLPELTESSIPIHQFISLKNARQSVTPENDEIFNELNAICCVAERECDKLYSSSIPTTTTVLDSISLKIEPVDRSGDNDFSIEKSLFTLRLRRMEIKVDKFISLNSEKGIYDPSVLVPDYATMMTNIWKQFELDTLKKTVLDFVAASSDVRHCITDFQERIDSLETKIKELNGRITEQLSEHDRKIQVLEEEKSKQSDQNRQLMEKNGLLEALTRELKQKIVELESTVKELKFDQRQTDKNIQNIINQNIQNKIINNNSNWAVMLCIAVSALSLCLSMYQ